MPARSPIGERAGIASGAAALVWSAHPDWSANQVLRVLFDTAGRTWKKDSPSKYGGYGIVRPAVNILRGKGNPGDPKTSPILKPGLSDSSSPTPSASSSSQQPDAKGKDGGETPEASGSTNDDSQLGLVLGLAAAGAALAAGSFALARKRRNA